MQALLFPIFNYVAANRWAQIALGLGLFYAIWRGNEEIAERRGAARIKRRMEKQATQTKIKTIAKAKETANERVIQARRAREKASMPIDRPDGERPSDGLSDDDANILFN